MSTEGKPTVEWIRARPAHPVHIPEHLRGVVRDLSAPEQELADDYERNEHQ